MREWSIIIINDNPHSPIPIHSLRLAPVRFHEKTLSDLPRDSRGITGSTAAATASQGFRVFGPAGVIVDRKFLAASAGAGGSQFRGDLRLFGECKEMWGNYQNLNRIYHHISNFKIYIYICNYVYIYIYMYVCIYIYIFRILKELHASPRSLPNHII